MAHNKSVNWERWVQGELIASLQAKGKLPKKQTEAAQYKDKAYHNTHTRIFPPSDIDPSYAATMLAEARSRLTTATGQIQAAQQKEHQQQQLEQQQQHSPGRNFAVQAGQLQQQGSSPKHAGHSSSGSMCGSHVGSTASHRTHQTNKSELKARMVDLEKQLAQETRSVEQLQAAIAEAKGRPDSRRQ